MATATSTRNLRTRLNGRVDGENSADDGDCEAPTIRPYRRGDERDIVQLLRWPYSHDRAMDHWRWKLAHWRSSAANVWLAIARKRPVFHYGGIPLTYTVDGSITATMISVDAMTAPEFRRQGLLTRGVAGAFAEWNARGVAFTLGLPNERWGSRTAIAGWQSLFPLEWLVRPLRPEVFAARRLGMPWLRRASIATRLWRRWPRNRLRRDPQIELEKITRADDSFDRLWEACGSDARFSAVRDRAWVQWRFLSAPTRTYHVVLARRGDEAVGYSASYIAKTSRKTSAFLADLFGRDDDAVAQETLLADVIANSYDAGADVVAALAVPGTTSHDLLRRSGFFRGPAFAVHIVPFSTDLPIDSMRQARHWRLSGADFDVV